MIPLLLAHLALTPQATFRPAETNGPFCWVWAGKDDKNNDVYVPCHPKEERHGVDLSGIVDLSLNVGTLTAAVLGPFSTATNFSIDLAGAPDTRPTTWGNAGFAQNPIVFSPPAGYRVRILRVTGDFIYWPKVGTVPVGTSAEVGWGLKSTAPDGSALVSNAYDNSMVWLQAVCLPGSPQSRVQFDVDTHLSALLSPDNTLISQTFVALNTTGLTIHMEPTMMIWFQFEKEEGNANQR